MVEVKTIVCNDIINSDRFDEEVNKVIKEGWQVVNRQAISGYSRGSHNYEPKLIAFMERNIDELNDYFWKENTNVK